jgi:hypothetical protein
MPKLPDGAERPTPDEQLARWMAGDPVCPNTSDECCPDFSCCNPKLLADPLVRKAFVQGSPGEREHWLGGFLGAAIAELAPDKNVHIAGRDPSEES